MWSVSPEWRGHPQPTDLQLISSNGVSLMNPSGLTDTQPSVAHNPVCSPGTIHLPSEQKWQWLHSYGKSHTVPVVTWSTEAGSHSKRKGGAGDFIWKPPVGFEWHAAHYVAVVIRAKLLSRFVYLCVEFKSSNSKVPWMLATVKLDWSIVWSSWIVLKWW